MQNTKPQNRRHENKDPQLQVSVKTPKTTCCPNKFFYSIQRCPLASEPCLCLTRGVAMCWGRGFPDTHGPSNVGHVKYRRFKGSCYKYQVFVIRQHHSCECQGQQENQCTISNPLRSLRLTIARRLLRPSLTAIFWQWQMLMI